MVEARFYPHINRLACGQWKSGARMPLALQAVPSFIFGINMELKSIIEI
jgi:hypothetical protein